MSDNDPSDEGKLELEPPVCQACGRQPKIARGKDGVDFFKVHYAPKQPQGICLGSGTSVDD